MKDFDAGITDEQLAAEARTARKALAAAVNSKIRREGNEIILPAKPKPMTATEGVAVLQAVAKEEETLVDVHEVIEGNAFDALVSFQAVLKEEFGFATVEGKSFETFFGTIEVPVQILNVRTGPGPQDFIQVPTGTVTAPTLGFKFDVSPAPDGMHIKAKVKKLDAPILKHLAALTREHLKENSIYRGKAFRQPTSWDQQPEFLSFDHVSKADLVLNHNVAVAVDEYLMGHIEDKVRGKWMAVLSGFYGNGKSFLMAILAQAALKNGRTVIYSTDTSQIASAITMGSNRYGPILVIAEDLDRVVDDREDEANDIINTISGVLSNSMDAMVVVSTNHPEKIDKAMIRPGRVDVYLELPLPNEDSIAELIHVYGKGRVEVNGFMGEITRRLVGRVASATVKNVVDLARKSADRRGQLTITENNLLAAVTVMEPQLELLNRHEPDTEHPLVKGFRQLIAQAAGVVDEDALVDLLDDTGSGDELHRAVDRVAHNL